MGDLLADQRRTRFRAAEQPFEPLARLLLQVHQGHADERASALALSQHHAQRRRDVEPGLRDHSFVGQHRPEGFQLVDRRFAQPQQGRKTQPEAGILLRHDLRRDQRQRRAHDPGPPAFDVLGLCLQGGRSRDGRPGLRGPQRRRRDHAAGQDLDRQRQSQVHLRHDQQLLVEGA